MQVKVSPRLALVLALLVLSLSSLLPGPQRVSASTPVAGTAAATTPTPQPTTAPQPSPSPLATPVHLGNTTVVPTATPQPSADPEPTAVPKPSAVAQPSTAPQPTSAAAATPVPTVAPSPSPSAPPANSGTTVNPGISGTPRVAVDSPSPTPEPSASPIPSPSPSAEPSPSPVDNGPGVPLPPAGPAVAPAQLLPIFEQAAGMTGVPRDILLAIARVESGFDPRAVGPYLPQLAGTENEHALGLMQILPSTYRPYAAKVDGITGKNLGMTGIWDAESSIYAAAFYLADNGAPGDLRRALFAYNNADWYVDLVLAWAATYASGLVADPNFAVPSGGAPVILAAPENPLQPSIVGRHLDVLSPIPLYLPFTAGETWYAGGDGSFYGEGFHNDAGGMFYDVDLNKGTWPRSEEDAGEPVLAAADGLINNVYATEGGGWTVEMYHRAPDGTLLRTHYLHLKDDPRISAGIKVNQVVPHGTVIGFVGNTGSTSTGAHLHFGIALWQDTGWLSIRPEPMEGQYLKSGLSLVSHNDPANKAAFDQTWNVADRQVATAQGRSWLWGPQPLTGALLENYGQGTTRVVQYWDKGRMERTPDGKSGFLTTVGALALELLTGKIDLGGGQTSDVGPAQIPLVGPVKDTDRNVAARAASQPLPDTLAPTYADAAVEAAKKTTDHAGTPVTWLLRPGGKVEPFAGGAIPPANVTLTNFDATTGHNIASVFADWYSQTFFTSPDGDPAHALAAQLQGSTANVDPGHPLTDPFWVEVTIDGTNHLVLVQIFERWVLTYNPANPAGWQVELGNVGLHYYSWRYEAPLHKVALDLPDRVATRRDWGAGARRSAALRHKIAA